VRLTEDAGQKEYHGTHRPAAGHPMTACRAGECPA
jgi:hypothetical protein